MHSEFPEYCDLDIANYKTHAGFYTLGFIKQHRPDIEIIHFAEFEPSLYDSFNWLKEKIDQGLKNNKNVGLFIWDETSGFNEKFAEFLTQYQNNSVYVFTQLDSFCMLKYKDLGIKNIIELPWWLLNECLIYYKLCNSDNTIVEFDGHNFLCMVKRPDHHKHFLIDQLEHFKDIGVITSQFSYKNFPKPNIPPISSVGELSKIIKSYTKINNTWVSVNTINYLNIEKIYKHIPLIINPETNFGTSIVTEKSIWPLLLGRLSLVAGRHCVMNYIQRFYDLDFKKYINLDFDSAFHSYTLDDTKLRIKKMIVDNKDLILNAKEVYKTFSVELENARWSLGKNFYNFFVGQINKIPLRNIQ